MAAIAAARPGFMRPPLLSRVRSDALPEHASYSDDGCEVAARCLDCPLPVCRYEVAGGVRELLNNIRDSQIRALRASGAPIHELAERFGVTRRTVFRVLAVMGVERLQPGRCSKCGRGWSSRVHQRRCK